MGDAIEQAAERVIEFMHDNLGEQLTIDDMARAALFSKFHFSRIFQRATGLSPGRFLSALRLQKAKQLLVSTSLSVADISLRVGYASVGTFSSRFTRSVGLSPTTYRRLGGYTTHLSVNDSYRTSEQATGTVRGTIWQAPGVRHGRIFVGLFPDRIPEGRPVRCTILDVPGPFKLDLVPTGVWHLLAHSVAGDSTAQPDGQTPPCVGRSGPLVVGLGTVIDAELRLNPMRILDPPVLLALLDVRRAALERESAERTARTAGTPAGTRIGR